MMELFKQVMPRYARLVICLAPVLFLFVFCKDADAYFTRLSDSLFLTGLQWVAMLAALLFGLKLSHDVINLDKKSYLQSWKDSYKSIAIVIFSIIVLLLFIVGLFKVVMFASHYFSHEKSYILSAVSCLLLIASFPVLFLLVKFSQVVPLIIADKASLLDALQVGPQLVNGRLGLAVRPVAFILVFYLFSCHGTRHAQYLLHHNLLIPFDFLSMLLVMPIFYGVMLLLLSDLQLRDKLAGI